MKIDPEDFETLKENVTEWAERFPYERYNGLVTAERWRWDMFYHATPENFRARLYDYLDDSHIDTALRQITGTA